MTFLHKLAKRLARLKAVLLVGAIATIACEVPLADPASTLAQLHLSPKTLNLRTNQTSQFVVVALTPAGDTAVVGVHWSTTGGSIVDSGTTGRTHFLSYQSPSQAGQYKVITQGAGVGLGDSAVVNVSASPVASVSVSPGSATMIEDQTAQLIATPLDSSGVVLTGRALTWGSSNPSVATVSTSGLVLGLAVGSAILTASSEGKNGIATVTVTPVPVASVSVSPASVSVTVGESAPLAATPRDAGGNTLAGRVVIWGSSNTAVATVNGNGLVTGVAAGLVTITASSEGKNGTSAVTVTLTPAPVASVVVSPGTASVSTGQTVQLVATPRDASGNALLGRVVTWGSSNTGLATVSVSGLVTGVGAGVATITATSEGQSGSSAITITAPVASVSVSPTPASVTAGQTVQLTATPRDAGGNVLTGRVVTWSSSNNLVARVSSNGLVTGVAAGSATITATIESRNGTAAVTVTPAPVASVSVSPTPASVTAAQTVQLFATLRDAGGNALVGRVVTWVSSNTAAATVNGSGLVTGVAAGSTTITATSEGINGTATVTVTAPAPPPPGGTWPNEPAGLTVLTDLDFHTLSLASPWGSFGGGSVISDATAPLSPPSVFQISYPIGFGGGSAPVNYFYEPANFRRTELYTAFWIKVSNPWQGHSSGVNKILFFNTGGTATDAPVPEMFGQARPYHLRTAFFEMGATENRDWGDQNAAGNPEFTLGVWHRIEIYMKYGTSSSSYNGIYKQWLDGVLVMNYTDINYAHDGFSAIKINPTWGGIGDTKSENDYYLIDHFHASAR